MTFSDPLMPEIPQIDGLRCEDHATYIADSTHKIKFVRYWGARGFTPLAKTFRTRRFPAEHIALVEDPTKSKGACEKMVGLSISTDFDSPINKSLGLCGMMRWESDIGWFTEGKLQHIAYDVDPKKSMEEVSAELEARGVQFMTPILRYQEPSGATLEQRFVACRVPYGPFIEIIRRGLGQDGQPFQGFNENQIDNLYEHYENYSRRLLK